MVMLGLLCCFKKISCLRCEGLAWFLKFRLGGVALEAVVVLRGLAVGACSNVFSSSLSIAFHLSNHLLTVPLGGRI